MTCHRVFNNSASGIVPALVANVPVILCTGLLLNLSQSLHSCRRTHLHIAVVHNTVYYVSDICCKVLEMTLIPGLYYTAAEWCFLKSHILCFHFVIVLVKNSMSKGQFIQLLYISGLQSTWSAKQLSFLICLISENSSFKKLSLCLAQTRRKIP